MPVVSQAKVLHIHSTSIAKYIKGTATLNLGQSFSSVLIVYNLSVYFFVHFVGNIVLKYQIMDFKLLYCLNDTPSQEISE